MSNEQRALHTIMLAIGSLPNVRVFRNNVGMAMSPAGNPIRYGLTPGSSDLIGWTTKTITPEMVGQKIAIFTAIEVKGETGSVSAKQHTFLENVHRSGGIAGIAKSPTDALNIITQKK